VLDPGAEEEGGQALSRRM